MKRPIRPLFSICLLVATAATLISTLRLLLRITAPATFSKQAQEKPFPPHVVFNATLLRYAVMDLDDANMKQEIQELVGGSMHATTEDRQRSFLTFGNYFFLNIGIPSARGIQFLSPEFHQLRLEFSRGLQDWARKRVFDPDIMSHLANVVGQYDHVLGSGRKYKTCAVVGNSGVLLNTTYGDVIDSHEFVIRLNNAMAANFEQHVGKKTSLSFMNSHILHICARGEDCHTQYCHPYGENVPIVMYICQPLHFLDYILCSNSSHKAPLEITDPRFDVLCASIAKYYSLKRFFEETGGEGSVEEWVAAHEGANFHYSTGMQAVMLALGVCDKVSIFGFGKLDSAKHHYHTNQKAESSLHHYEAEYDLYRDMVGRPHCIPFVSDKFQFPPVVWHQ